MNENTIRNLVEVLGIAIQDRAAGRDLDINTLRVALTNAVQEVVTALQPDPRLVKEDMERAITKAVRDLVPPRT